MHNGLNHFVKLGQVTEYAEFKGVPMPQLAVIGAGVLLLVAGVALLLGKFPVIGVAASVLFFLPVTFRMHSFLAIQKPWGLNLDSSNK